MRDQTQGSPEMPRVLWVADKLGYDERMHGLGAYFMQVLLAAPAGRIVPVVLRADDRLLEQFRNEGVTLKHVPYGRLDPRTLGALIRLIREEDVELVHLHGYGSSTFGRIAARVTGRPAIIHQHDSIMHAPWYGKIADRLLGGWNGTAIACSQTVADYCVTARAVPRSRVRTLMNAVAAPRPYDSDHLARWLKTQSIPRDARLIGSLTRLMEEKGVRYLIQSLPELLRMQPDAVVLIFGGGEQQTELESLAQELSVAEHVRFLGFQPDATGYLAMLDCFVLPSVSEGLPFALMEALAAGLPVVVTAVGGMAELLTHGVDGFLVPTQDPAALADGLDRVLGDFDLADRLRQGALRTSRKFSIDRHVDALIDIYRETLRQSP